MLCPNCGQQMTVRNVDNEIVLHCATCGSSFFDKGSINRISQNSARTLTDEAQGQYILGNQKLCPKDKSILLEKVDATLPKNTILLECPSCEGIFAYPDDLLKYKGVKAAAPLASGAFKLLPAPKNLFMLASFAVLTVAVLLNTGSFSSNTRASNTTGKVTLSVSGPVLSVYFTSDIAQPAEIIFYNAQRQLTKRFPINPGEKTSSGKTYYSTNIRGFDRNTDAFYKVIFTGTDEKTIPFEEVQL
jgi:DNA-directed RNA polymerase subunit M/transcription elongation factor TFIIS